MNKKQILLVLAFMLNFVSYSQVGIGTSTPASSSILDLTATNKALLLTRVANTAAVTTPVNGMMVYDISANCFKSYENGTWTNCWGSVVGSIGAINCGGVINSGTLAVNQTATGVSSSIPYTGGNGGTHTGQIVTSTGVLGLTATLDAGSFATGAGTLTYTITGTPATVGTASFAINIGGQTCTLTRTVINLSSIPTGALSASTQTCFDIAVSNDFDNGCGGLSVRNNRKSDFTQTAVNTKIINISTTIAITELQVIYIDNSGNMITSVVQPAVTSLAANGSTTATINYNTNLNVSALGLDSANALLSDIYVLYKELGVQKQAKISIAVKDCACSLPTPNTGWTSGFVTADGKIFTSGWSPGIGRTGDVAAFEEVQYHPSITPKPFILNVSSGYYHSIALSSDGQIYGYGTGAASLGSVSSPTQVIKPVISGLNPGETAVQISAGYYASSFLTNQGRIFNTGGSITTFTPINLNVAAITSQNAGVAPVPVFLYDTYNNSFFIDSQGNLWGKGSNSYGNLGIGSTTAASNFTKVSFAPHKVASMSATLYNTVVLLSNGQVRIAGQTSSGLTSTLTSSGNITSFQPLELDGAAASTPIGTIIDVNLGDSYSGFSRLFLLDSSGKLFGKGYQYAGGLGIGNSNYGNVLDFTLCNITALNGEKIAQIKSYDWVTSLITESGKIFSAGSNSYNNLLSNPNTGGVLFPTFQPAALPNAVNNKFVN